MPPLSLAPTPLFSPHASSPAITWRTALSTFKAVDDRVRGGSSTSQTNLTASGQLLFSGFLDTTTLGGAGFASQQYGQSLPITLDKAGWQGLEVKVCSPPPSQKGGKEGNDQPGGGKGPVTSYVLNLYTTMPVKRPDGRNESSTVYEYNFNVSTSSAEVSAFHPAWSDFEPTYRGRPQPSAPKLDPEEIKMWSIMARSDFGSQSGPFELVVDSISAVKKGDSKKASLMTKRGISEDEEGNEWLRPARLNGAKGFALYAFSTVLLVAWSVWALVPEAWLKAVGVDWYPSR
ncbi:CIA30-domain-containing protein [Jaminaea rosea]|uniref:CIA30-domain-containing protein n=1 Tax=Jaminaea rosea TaxID=1569628 RepID=A0A316URW9_9BASI|nr:CIA30-domain-containing protein [Jaminaea rosea]PWN26623.1 CIA30-domain-containing protein [Jaminaea rosea]